MAKLAIRGHETRGKEVIELLEMLGGKTSYDCGYKDGFDSSYFFFIDENFYIDGLAYNSEELENCYILTLEEFLERFPYKVGDKIKTARINDFIGKIVNIRWDNYEEEVIYHVEWDDEIKSELSYYAKGLQPYKEETMEIKPNLLQQLKEYFDNTPREVLEKEWNELSYLNEIGPTVDEYLECVKKYRQSNKYPKTYGECVRYYSLILSH